MRHLAGRFMILQKPYGVPSLGFKQINGGVFKSSVHNALHGDDADGDEKYEPLNRTVTVADCIPQLAKIFNEPQLGFCSGLKRYCSGPLILPCGTSDYGKMRASLRTGASMGKEGANETFYHHSALVIVVGHPERKSGTVSGFATFQPVGDHKEYVFVEGGLSTKRQKTGKYAVQGAIDWDTIAVGHDCSLLHVQFGKFARHLPRLALAQIGCPVLGDDLYCKRFFNIDGKAVRVEPARAARSNGVQYTPRQLLARLGVDVLPALPMYLHVWQTVLPRYGSGNTDLVASAPPPQHFEAMVELLGWQKELADFWSELEDGTVQLD